MGERKSDETAKRVKGSIKEAFGKIVGNKHVEAEGAFEKAGGKPKAPATGVKNRRGSKP